jgi:hypothetical protein
MAGDGRHGHVQGIRQLGGAGADSARAGGQDPFSGHLFCFRGSAAVPVI